MSRPTLKRPPARKSYAQLTAQVDKFNNETPIGALVMQKDDLGDINVTRTTSVAWLLSGHTAVVMLENQAGAYLLDRVEPVDDPEERNAA